MGAPAGWYDDPQDQQLIRYFDGQSWTTQTAPRPGAGAGTQASSPQQGDPEQSAPQQSAPGWQQGKSAPSSAHQGPGQSQSSWQSQQRPAGQTQPQSPTAGFQFGGAQQVPTADAQPSPGTPKAVKIGILAAFLACLAIFALGYAMTDRDTGEGLTAEDLGIVDLGCPELVDEYVNASASDPDDQRLVSASGGSEDRNEIGEVKAPSGDGKNLVLSCEYPTAEWADGSQSGLALEVRVDKDLGLYVGAEKR